MDIEFLKDLFAEVHSYIPDIPFAHDVRLQAVCHLKFQQHIAWARNGVSHVGSFILIVVIIAVVTE